MMAAPMNVTPQLAAAFPESAEIGALLRARGRRVAVAESCTGGLLGAALTAVPGSSDYMLGGVIAYSNALKVALLDVPQSVLDEHGAVSEECARAMAIGVRERTGADIGVSITGVAGPGGESASKPAGLIWLAVSAADGAVSTGRVDGDHGREGNRAEAVRAALQMIRDAAQR
jgi:PncC family amidohydrolase